MITYDYEGKVALITGGASGIGLATARAFGRAGARVAIASRSEEVGRDACTALEREGVSSMFIATDVRDERSVEAMVAKTVERFGRLDFAVSSAGVGGDMAPLEKTNQDIWDDVLAINARGVWLAMRYEIPAMLSVGTGSIGVLGMTRSVALEYADRGIRVNAVCAGVTATLGMRRAETFVPEVVAALVGEHPIGRMATEEEIAGSALWLCSDGARYVTGAPIAVDGGFLAA
jgi:NAD(P)-dependent dehydrogenase (short-subunit alcohol dehydrogenase family)